MHAMSSARRSKLRELQEREAAKARMARLQTMLQQKLVQKYGSVRNPDSRLNQEIKDEVKAFAARSSRQPTDEEFLELENTVREIRTKYSKTRGTPSGDDGTWGGSAACNGGGSGGGGGGNGSRRSSRTGGKGPEDDDRSSSQGEGLPPSLARAWRTFDVAKQIEYETKEKQKVEKARLQKIRFREELEIHRSAVAAKKLQEEEEKRQHMEEQEMRLVEFRNEQDALKKLQADRHAEEKALRQEQVKRLQAEKEIERKARLEKEMQDIELCKAQLQGEVDVVEMRRQAEKERLAAIQRENAQQREVRAQKQRESDEADAKLLLEHRRRVDEEERMRADKLKERMKRYEDIGNFWSERGAGRAQADTEKREEEQTVLAARRKEEVDLERERNDKEKKRLASIKMAVENKKVIQEKNALTEKRQKEEMDYAQRFINDSEAFKRDERDKISKKKADMQRYRKQLELQVEETKTRRMHEDMNDTEFRLNSDIVKKLEADRHMVTQVRQRMENAR